MTENSENYERMLALRAEAQASNARNRQIPADNWQPDEYVSSLDLLEISRSQAETDRWYGGRPAARSEGTGPHDSWTEDIL